MSTTYTHEEIYGCHELYGADLDVQDCRAAIDRLPRRFVAAGTVSTVIPPGYPIYRLPIREYSGK